MGAVVMLAPPDPPMHEHPCGHDCLCELDAEALCDRCAIAQVVMDRHPSAKLTMGEAIARLYLSLRMHAIGR